MNYPAKSPAPAYGKWPLSQAQCQRIIRANKVEGISIVNLGKQFGVSKTTIAKVIRGEYTPEK